MADKKISDFSEAAAFEDTDLLLVSKSKTTYTVAGQKIKDYSKAAAQTQAQETAKPYADAAAASASDANAAKTAAETAKTNAQTAASDAASAKAAAQTANTNAQDAKTAALSAKTDAETAASTATAAAAAMQECAAYSSAKAYAVGNMATYNGSTYRCTTACTGVVPTNTANWLLIAAKGTDGQGAGDMLASVYDASNKKAQIATESELTTHTGNADIHVTADQKTEWNGKQAALTFDATPTSGSTNPVTSNGIYAALAAAGGLFVTTITYANSVYTADHTYDEIMAAYNAGKQCIVRYNDRTHHLYIANATGVYFAFASSYSVSNGFEDCYSNAFFINNSNSIIFKGSEILTPLWINRVNPVNAADTNYTTLMARGESLNSADTTPTVNGAICWTYG